MSSNLKNSDVSARQKPSTLTTKTNASHVLLPTSGTLQSNSVKLAQPTLGGTMPQKAALDVLLDLLLTATDSVFALRPPLILTPIIDVLLVTHLASGTLRQSHASTVPQHTHMINHKENVFAHPLLLSSTLITDVLLALLQEFGTTIKSSAKPALLASHSTLLPDFVSAHQTDLT